MLLIDKETMTIHLTRGDHAILDITSEGDDGGVHKFEIGDVVCLKVMKATDYKDVVLQKQIEIKEETEVATVELTSEQTKIGPVHYKAQKYHYEVELNRGGKVHTLVGYDKNGPKLLMLYPEGGENDNG